MQRLARQRLISVFRECGKSYAQTARRLGINRGTVYAILVWRGRISRRVIRALEIEIPPAKRRKNWRKKHAMLVLWIRRNSDKCQR